ncbi:hypothetical protein EGR_10416 [Echinococcus granulosus]|uniref:Uncharacterized protein n=1 Tax=Echinococcus granulosus TaxID=6210 RepID=W6U8E8_ECHGR|nr:hypothetical protein EGR_10416 [Echinococcus granulosus]EUB54717.1 hypothetical protein EGR_10416 [Echinococcus granulosus]
MALSSENTLIKDLEMRSASIISRRLSESACSHRHYSDILCIVGPQKAWRDYYYETEGRPHGRGTVENLLVACRRRTSAEGRRHRRRHCILTPPAKELAEIKHMDEVQMLKNLHSPISLPSCPADA